ncbi:MAG: ADP-ribosylglycohydrolase family protein [Planctomycetota bacterium]|jgi:ADP-ribosylglycohydrolase|nr:ADP-ribosylglycohydrolase family protein [Planctomycetota bacterium]
MFVTPTQLRSRLAAVLETLDAQGHDISQAQARFEALDDSYDAIIAFGNAIGDLPMRADWQWDEPIAWEGIEAAMDPARTRGAIGSADVSATAARVRTAFEASVCGCILGKPVECNPSLDELRQAGEQAGCWPFNDYLPEALLTELSVVRGCRSGHWSQTETLRERIRYAAADDDINYSVMGMMLLEQHGLNFSQRDVAKMWFSNIPPGWAWGPERTQILNHGWNSILGGEADASWVTTWNPGSELCGAAIRADAYGFACPGDPATAAWLAYKDASFTHVRNGVYATMYIAAVIATAAVCDNALEVHRTALQYIPQNSRLASAVRFSIDAVAQASDWLDGYRRIHDEYIDYSHCRVYQEIGTLVNTLHFAESIDDGFCKQVMQGNDTDSFGCTSGSMCGMFMDPDRFDRRWLKPFQDTINIGLATVHEHRLSALAERMAQLPALVARGGAETGATPAADLAAAATDGAAS